MSTPIPRQSNFDNPTESGHPDEAKPDGAVDARAARRKARLESQARELDDLLREEDARFLRRSRSQRRRRLRERADPPTELIRFAVDITTPYGWLAATDKLIRRFAAGKIEYRQFDAMLKALELVAREGNVCSSRLLRIPKLASVPAGAFVIEADMRSRSARKSELLRLSQRRASEPERDEKSGQGKEADRKKTIALSS